MLTRRIRTRQCRPGLTGRRTPRPITAALSSLSPIVRALDLPELDTLSRDNIDARPRAVELADGRFMVVELESFLWDCLDQICDESNLSVSSLCSLISTTFPDMAMRHALSSYIVEYFRQARPA